MYDLHRVLQSYEHRDHDMRLQASQTYGQLHAFPSLTIDNAGGERRSS